jgi:hypothetical protein
VAVLPLSFVSPLFSAPLDRLLLEGYDPQRSAAWPGAAPSLYGASQLELALEAGSFAPSSPADDSSEYFRSEGFTVRRIQGEGAATVVNEFAARHHYLTSGGMNGERMGLYARDGEHCGIAVFAPCTNLRTAAGMQVGAGGDEHLSDHMRAHLTYTEAQYRDCVRLCLAEQRQDGSALGTGAESFLYTGCLGIFEEENRQLWRALRWAEKLGDGSLRVPLPEWAHALLTSGADWVKCVRSFADPAAGHRGTIYQAAGAWYLGKTRAEGLHVGRRSGEPASRRSLSKLGTSGHGHVHQALRAVWEGGAGRALLRGPDGVVLHEEDLAWIRRAVPDGLIPAVRERALRSAWHGRQAELRAGLIDAGCDAKVEASTQRAARITHARWEFEVDLSGYEVRKVPAKHRYGHFLGSGYFAHQLARRCRYLRKQILASEATWYAPAARWPRGLGFGWRERPEWLGRPEYPKS